MTLTYKAFDGVEFYDRVAPDGTKQHGRNQDDRSIVAICTHRAYEGQRLVDFLNTEQITPTGVVRAFDACGLPGLKTFLDAVSRLPELASWYAQFTPLTVVDNAFNVETLKSIDAAKAPITITDGDLPMAGGVGGSTAGGGGSTAGTPVLIQSAITGYRQLSQAESDLMNEGKALAQQCGAFIAKLRAHPPVGAISDVGPALDQRWISIGATKLQEGFMCVTRGIAQPTTF